MNILIAVPTYENIAPETFKSIYGLKSQHRLAFDFVRGYDCAKARNEIAKKAMAEGFDYVLMVDSDIILPEDAIEALIEDNDSVVVGIYPRKNTNCGETELFKLGTYDYVNRYNYNELEELPDRFQIKGSGLGCALINTEIFNRLPYPYFKFVTYDDGDVLSEDLFFCSNLAQTGISVYADSRVRCGHLTKGILW